MIAVLRIDHARIRANGMAGIRPNIRNAAVIDGDIAVRNNFTGLHAHPPTSADHQVRRAAAHGAVDQLVHIVD